MGEDGLYEADPSDFGTTHSVSPYYCPKCHSLKNVSVCVSPHEPMPGNEDLIRRDSDLCENCGSEMQLLDKKKEYNCPRCGKKHFRFIKSSECWT